MAIRTSIKWTLRLAAMAAFLGAAGVALKRADVPETAIYAVLPFVAAPTVVSCLAMSWTDIARVHLALWAGAVVGYCTTDSCAPLASIFFALPAAALALGVFEVGRLAMLRAVAALRRAGSYTPTRVRPADQYH